MVSSNNVYTKYVCPLCGESNTRRRSTLIRNARFCKHHGEEYAVNVLMDIIRRAKRRAS